MCWTPTLRLKMTATDQAFHWCWLFGLVFWFLPTKCGVCPEKVGKMAFFGCSEFQWTKFHENYSFNWKEINPNFRCSEMLWLLAFRWLNWKSVLHHNNRAWWDFPQSVSAVGFLQKKPNFWESVSFHCEMFCLTNFGLVLHQQF